VELESFLPAASELLAIPSTARRPRDLHRALDFVLGYVSAPAEPGASGGGPFTIERFESNGKPSALIYPGGTRPESGVILNGHLDVVPAPDEQFRPLIADGRLYARGAQDMKVSGLAMAAVFRDLARDLPYPLGLQLVTDEESGGYDGTGYQLAHDVTCAFAILGETSRLSIVTESKGVLNVTLTAEGRSAHGAYPWLGQNALLRLNRTIARILGAHPVPDSEAWRTTVNLARVATPNEAYNQVPAAADAWLDIRFPAGDADLDGKDETEVTAYLAGFCEPGVTPVVVRLDSPAHADTRRPEIAALRDAARAQGFDGAFLRKHGTSDARFFRQRGINAVSFGVGGDGQHGPSEYAELSTILPYSRALSTFLQTFPR
jgi:succinyl-diaminopimelate desuccinylase